MPAGTPRQCTGHRPCTWRPAAAYGTRACLLAAGWWWARMGVPARPPRAGRGTGEAAPPRARGGGGKDAVVTCTLHVAWDDRLTRYDFGPAHPLAPIRVELTVELARAFGVLDAPGVTVAAPEPAGTADLELVHDAAYIGVVRQVSADP